jgi:hypothetical protein
MYSSFLGGLKWLQISSLPEDKLADHAGSFNPSVVEHNIFPSEVELEEIFRVLKESWGPSRFEHDCNSNLESVQQPEWRPPVTLPVPQPAYSSTIHSQPDPQAIQPALLIENLSISTQLLENHPQPLAIANPDLDYANLIDSSLSADWDSFLMNGTTLTSNIMSNSATYFLEKYYDPEPAYVTTLASQLQESTPPATVYSNSPGPSRVTTNYAEVSQAITPPAALATRRASSPPAIQDNQGLTIQIRYQFIWDTTTGHAKSLV